MQLHTNGHDDIHAYTHAIREEQSQRRMLTTGDA